MELISLIGILVSVMFGIVALIGIIKPMEKIGMPNRVTALKVWIFSCVVFVFCIILLPNESTETEKESPEVVENKIPEHRGYMTTWEIKEALERKKKAEEQAAKNPKNVDKPKPKETPRIVENPVMPTISASKLHEEYVSNAVRANSKYLRKFVRVTGTVRIVTPDNQGDYAVGLGTEKNPLVVRANFKSTLEHQVKKINVGDSIVVSCQVAGVGPDNNIHLFGAMLEDK